MLRTDEAADFCTAEKVYLLRYGSGDLELLRSWLVLTTRVLCNPTNQIWMQRIQFFLEDKPPQSTSRNCCQ